MSGEDKEKKDEGLPVVPPAAPQNQHDAPAAGVARGGAQTILLVTGVVLLAVSLIMSSLALAFALGDRECVREPGRMMRRGGMNRGGQVRQELKDLASGGEVSIVRGTVGTVQGGNVTVVTPTGNETVVVTDGTRFRGPASAGEQAGVSSLKAGETVTVFAKKTADGKLEAVVVRRGAETAPEK